jgi:hypothetical protein
VIQDPRSGRSRRFDPPRLTFGPLSGRVYIVSHGKDLGDGNVEATKKYDITNQFEALARNLGWTPPPSEPEPEAGADYTPHHLR